MRSVRYSLLALTVLVGSTIATGARAQEREHRFSPEAKSLPARTTGELAERYVYEHQHRLARLQRLHQIAHENNNKKRLEQLDRLFDRLESNHRRQMDDFEDYLTPEARTQRHDRRKSSRAKEARQGVIERRQDRHEQRDAFVENHRQDAKDRRDKHRQAASDHRDNRRQAGIQRRESHREASQLRRNQHQEARQENLGKHHESVKQHRESRQNRGNRGDRGVGQHRQRNNRDASLDARQKQRGRRGEKVGNHRGQAGRDSSSSGYRRSPPGNRQLASRIKGRKQSHQSPNSKYRKSISKKPAHKYRSQHKLDDEIRRSITSRNANEEFERLIREIEDGP